MLLLFLVVNAIILIVFVSLNTVDGFSAASQRRNKNCYFASQRELFSKARIIPSQQRSGDPLTTKFSLKASVTAVNGKIFRNEHHNDAILGKNDDDRSSSKISRKLQPVTAVAAEKFTSTKTTTTTTTRRNVLFSGAAIPFGFLTNILAFSANPMNSNAVTNGGDVSSSAAAADSIIAYKTVELPMDDKFSGINVPISVWYPLNKNYEKTSSSAAAGIIKGYQYKISLRRIGQLLAKWEFIPEFISKEFTLIPSSSTATATTSSKEKKTIRVVDGTNLSITKNGDDVNDGISSNDSMNNNYKGVVFLAHGFLGSRSDLGYLAEELASIGYVCVAAEYPESLEASYPRIDGLTRTEINKLLVPFVENNLLLSVGEKKKLSYSAIGHSLGCGTVLQMGDDTWNRVLMGSGRAPLSPTTATSKKSVGDEVYKNPVIGGRLLFISSVNDGPVTSWGGGITIPEEYIVLDDVNKETAINSMFTSTLSKRIGNEKRVAYVFRNPDTAPNHISYLSENVNDAMLSFLSPLLPLTKALSIPVLDFDKYSISRDSVATSETILPLITTFLEQEGEGVIKE